MYSGLNFKSEIALMYKARAYTYIPDNTRVERPITISDLKPHIKVDFLDPDRDQEAYLNFLIDAAVDSAERFTNRSFINRKWKTYRDFFGWFVVLERGTNAVVNSYKYKTTDSVFVEVDPSLYYVAVKDPYSKIILKEEATYPTDIIDQQNSVEIEFTAGYGATKDTIPPMLKLLLCQHVAWIYENKGNCPVGEIPPIVLDGYKKHFRVIDINGSTYL